METGIPYQKQPVDSMQFPLKFQHSSSQILKVPFLACKEGEVEHSIMGS